MYRLSAHRTVYASPQVVWQVISDIEHYADYAPNLSKAIKTSEGNHPTRRCYDNKGQGWNETCVLWREGEVYAFEVDTTPADYPYPFTKLKGTWGLNTVENGTEIYMYFDYALNKSGVLGWLMNRMMHRSFTPIVEELLDNWEAEIVQQSNELVQV